ncbi:MAG TPA: PEP-CTERM sorting domain-containing protein [Cellvibrio sp.]|nr:PEP-CTERM sorting domain-containing protein [Cellvibrio sp.]
MNKLLKPLFALAITFTSSLSFAGQLPVFSGWTVFGSEDQTGSGEYYLTPGYGGQKFDAEYLFYKLNGNSLSVGLQTGFDIISDAGQYRANDRYYFGGDLALSFDGNTSNYEYAIDFGNLTKNYAGTTKISAQGNASGIDTAGLYKANSWNNDIAFGQSAPYGVSNGSLLLAANSGNFSQGSGILGSDKSYFTMFTFDLSNITGLQPNFVLDAHWTMSCGNDAIDGRVALAKVPEPSPLLLFVLGFAGLVLARRKLK